MKSFKPTRYQYLGLETGRIVQIRYPATNRIEPSSAALAGYVLEGEKATSETKWLRLKPRFNLFDFIGFHEPIAVLPNGDTVFAYDLCTPIGAKFSTTIPDGRFRLVGVVVRSSLQRLSDVTETDALLEGVNRSGPSYAVPEFEPQPNRVSALVAAFIAKYKLPVCDHLTWVHQIVISSKR
jgi:hypothetical protein